MSEAVKLKPCPFCGSSFKISVEPHDNHPVAGMFYIYHDHGPVGSPARSCILDVRQHFSSELEAAEAWNKRADSTNAEKERIRFEGDLDKWMKTIGAGITGYQPEAYAVMDLACIELVKLRSMLAFLNKNVDLELVWQEVNGDPSECGWHLFRRFGGRSDRDFKVVGTGETVEEAIAGAMDLGMLAAAPALIPSEPHAAEGRE